MNENEKGIGHFLIWDGGFFKILRPKLFLAEPGQSNYNGNRHSKRGRMHMKSIMLCYNLKGTKKGRKIGMLGSFLGFRVKYVEKEEYSKTIGVLTGLKEEVAEEASREETSGTDNEKNEEITDFEEEMLVMLLADNRILDKLLFQMKKEKVQVPLKAIVTAKNQNWTSTALYSEIKREHESMTKAEQAGKKKEE